MPDPQAALRLAPGGSTPTPSCSPDSLMKHATPALLPPLQAALRLAPGGPTTDLLSALGLCQVSQGDLQASCLKWACYLLVSVPCMALPVLSALGLCQVSWGSLQASCKSRWW